MTARVPAFPDRRRPPRPDAERRRGLALIGLSGGGSVLALAMLMLQGWAPALLAYVLTLALLFELLTRWSDEARAI